MTPTEKLIKKCNDWGWKIKQLEEVEFDNLIKENICLPNRSIYLAPFADLCIDLNNKIFNYTNGLKPSDLIHEMGHVFSTKDPINKVNELTFFGWEYNLAVEIQIAEEWIRSNDDYNLGRYNDLKKIFNDVSMLASYEYMSSITFFVLTREEKIKFLQECINYCIKAGSIINGSSININQ